MNCKRKTRGAAQRRRAQSAATQKTKKLKEGRRWFHLIYDPTFPHKTESDYSDCLFKESRLSQALAEGTWPDGTRFRHNQTQYIVQNNILYIHGSSHHGRPAKLSGMRATTGQGANLQLTIEATPPTPKPDQLQADVVLARLEQEAGLALACDRRAALAAQLQPAIAELYSSGELPVPATDQENIASRVADYLRGCIVDAGVTLRTYQMRPAGVAIQACLPVALYL